MSDVVTQKCGTCLPQKTFYVEKWHRPHTKKRVRHVQLVACKITVQRSVWTVSTEATRKSRRTCVDATLPLNERGKRFGICLVLSCVPHHARPLRSCPLFYFLTISGSENDCGEWLVSMWYVHATARKTLFYH